MNEIDELKRNVWARDDRDTGPEDAMSRGISSTLGSSAAEDEARPPGPEDVWIAIMGMTGTGKSSLISTLVGYDVGIGHELQSSKS